MPDRTTSPFTDDQLRAIAKSGWTPTTQRLAAELLAHRNALAAIKAADPDLFDDSEERGGAYETYGSAGDGLRWAYVAAVAPLTAQENEIHV
ncbi:hypothetical protein [Nocardia sp. NBC_01327]|uniref:hypothetical protein n=1 Tax=Nocardia sp. NBC_01327 TaxID=2903593 RepID=UPI002E123662|nr:hypothetical protein OG326_24085 [Nocardia sp. NBC_01327]